MEDGRKLCGAFEGSMGEDDRERLRAAEVGVGGSWAATGFCAAMGRGDAEMDEESGVTLGKSGAAAAADTAFSLRLCDKPAWLAAYAEVARSAALSVPLVSSALRGSGSRTEASLCEEV